MTNFQWHFWLKCQNSLTNQDWKRRVWNSLIFQDSMSCGDRVQSRDGSRRGVQWSGIKSRDVSREGVHSVRETGVQSRDGSMERVQWWGIQSRNGSIRGWGVQGSGMQSGTEPEDVSRVRHTEQRRIQKRGPWIKHKEQGRIHWMDSGVRHKEQGWIQGRGQGFRHTEQERLHFDTWHHDTSIDLKQDPQYL